MLFTKASCCFATNFSFFALFGFLSMADLSTIVVAIDCGITDFYFLAFKRN